MRKWSGLTMLLATLNTVWATPNSPGTDNPTNETTSQITWQWTASSGTKQGYRIYDAASGGVPKQQLGSNSTNWTETGLTAGLRYTNYVCAYDGTGESTRTQLPSAMASYPVTWHPTNSLQARANADTYIAQVFSNNSYASAVVVRCGYGYPEDTNLFTARRAMVQFDESALPAATLWRAGVGRASSSMYATAIGAAESRTITGWRISADWNETLTVPTWTTFNTNKESSALVSLSVGGAPASYTWQWDPYAAGMPTNHQGLMFIDADETDNRWAVSFASKDNTNGYSVPTMSMDYYLPPNPQWVTNLLVLAGVGGASMDTATYATTAGLTGDTDLYGNSTKTYGGKTWVNAVGDVTDAAGFSDHYGWNLNGTGSPFNMGVSNCALFNLYVNSSTAVSGCYLRCGSDDGVRLIVNGTTVGTDDATRTWAMEQSVFGPFNLNAGWNRVLIKVRNGVSNSGLKAVRFSNADATVWSGSTLTFAADDTTPPANPTSCTESGGASSGVWQSTVSSPRFTWSGAADSAAAGEGASGIRGYRVYFGPSANGVPTSSIQPALTCAPGPQTQGAYYLRVSTVDNAMNESTPVTLFAFQYAASVVPDNSTVCVGSPITWTALGGFGTGQVQYYRYAWDQSATHAWTDTEAQWLSGTLPTTPTAAGTWYLHVRGYNGQNAASGSYDYAVAANALPGPQAKSLTTSKNRAATISTGKLLAGATNASSFVGAQTTTVGASVTVANGIVTYTPKADFTGTDTFTFTLASSAGCCATGTVTVTVDAGNAQPPNGVYAGTEGNQFVVRFAGIPGETYTIESAPSTDGPWNKLGANVTVPTTDQGWGIGVFEIRDPISHGQGFYRTVWPAY